MKMRYMGMIKRVLAMSLAGVLSAFAVTGEEWTADLIAGGGNGGDGGDAILLLATPPVTGMPGGDGAQNIKKESDLQVSGGTGGTGGQSFTVNNAGDVIPPGDNGTAGSSVGAVSGGGGGTGGGVSPGLTAGSINFLPGGGGGGGAAIDQNFPRYTLLS